MDPVDPAPPGPAPPPAPPAPPPTPGLGAFLAAVVFLGFAGSIAQAASPVLGLVWTEVFAFLSPAVVLVAGRNLRPARYLRLGPARPAAILLGAAAGVAGYPAAAGLMALASLALPADQTIVVSDDPFADLAGAKRLGLRTAFVLCGAYSDAAVLERLPAEERPDIVARDYDELGRAWPG